MLKFYNIKNKRYYYISVNKDLFNDWVICVNRGGDRTHVIRHYGYYSLPLLISGLDEIVRRRLQRGYTLL